MSIKLQIERRLDVTVMKFDGRITLGERSAAYREAVREAVWEGHKKFAMDYSRITYVDSSGLGEWVAAYTIVRNSGGELVLYNLSEDTRRVLTVTKLFSVFEVFDALESALAHFESRRNRDFRVRERRYGPVSVLELEGEVSEQHGASRLLAVVQEAIGSGAVSVVALCPQVLDIDAFGGNVLRDARILTQKRRGDLVLAGIEPRLMPSIAAAGVSELTAFASIDEALVGFGMSVDRTHWRVEAVRAR